MLSLIVCSRSPALFAQLERNVNHTIGVPHEIVRVNNEQGRLGICKAYNQGMTQARGDVLVFVHEDVLFITRDWGVMLLEEFADPAVGAVGVAGSSVLPRSNDWFRAGQPYIHGHMIHAHDTLHDSEIYYAPNDATAEVVVLDGVFIAVRAALARELCFDEDFKGFDYYDMDFTLRVSQHAKLLVLPKLTLKHLSNRAFAAGYFYNPLFQQKHGGVLPYGLGGTHPAVEGNTEVAFFMRTIPRVHAPEEQSVDAEQLR